MKKILSFGFPVLVLFLLAVIVTAPVSAVTIGSSAAETIISTPAATSPVTAVSAAKSSVSATVSSIMPTAGDSVVISGAETGGNVSSGVRIWVFAGNYVNVAPVTVSPDGSFSKTYPTAGLPPATYYVFVQNPGPAGVFDIDLQDMGQYSGQVVNVRTGGLIFNFTGIGSVHDAAAAQSLSDAINTQGNDDSYTKLTFQLVAPSAAGTSPASTSGSAAVPTGSQIPSPVPTTKSPLPLCLSLIAIGVGGMCVVLLKAKE